LKKKKKWPKHSKIQYYMVDQSDENQINNFFTKNNNFDLIIEDGSHFPSHQERCFRLGFEAISNGGIYIVEDIHSCLPDHELFKKEQGYLENEFTPSLLTLLLVFERCKRKQKQITESDLKQLSKNKNFNSSTVNRLFNLIDEINIYKRVTFPDRCWNCGRENFSYANYKCFCNVELYKMADSMTTVIKKKK